MRSLLLLALLAVSPACFAAPDDREFTTLFNGRDLTGWKYSGPVGKNNAWQVENGVLKNDLRPGKSANDLFTDRNFSDFTLRLEFLIPEGSNSGVYLRGQWEIQLTGDFLARKIGVAGNGAIYRLKAPDVFASKPSGEWQALEVTLVGKEVSAWLNGTRIHDRVVCGEPTGTAINRVVGAPGPILLQGRLGAVKFRNIRIKELAR